MDSFERHKIEYLILCKLLGTTLSPDEEVLFEQWLKHSSDNVELFDEIIEGQIVGKYTETALTVNMIDRIQAVHRKIKAKKVRRRRIWFTSAAAVALIMIVSAMVVTNNSATEDLSTLPIAGQTQRAMLQLDNNNAVALTENEQGEGWKKHLNSPNGKPIEDNKLVRITVPQGSDYHLLLSDGSQVWMNSESTIVYYTNFSEEKRAITLSGEAYFEVARNENKPFVVTARNAEIMVLGTSFNVSAYENDEVVAATLVEGEVEVATSGRSVRLTPGLQAKINRNGLISTSEVDVSLYTSWLKGVFDFEDMPLEEICLKLSRWYGVAFVFTGDAGEERFSGGAWMNAPLEDFLHHIELATDVKCTIKNGVVTITSRK